MPFWWKRSQWQEQLPQDETPVCYANMEVTRVDYKPDDTIRYYPSWSTPNKAGHLAKGKRKLSTLEIAQGKKKEQKYLTRICQICRGFSHRTIDCWLQEKKKSPPQGMEGQTYARDHQGSRRGGGRGGNEGVSQSITPRARQLAGV